MRGPTLSVLDSHRLELCRATMWETGSQHASKLRQPNRLVAVHAESFL